MSRVGQVIDHNAAGGIGFAGRLHGKRKCLRHRLAVRIHSIDIHDPIEEILQMFTDGPDFNRRIRLETQFQDDLYIQGDPHQVRQVFWNLLINAAQAMPEGGDLTIELRRRLPILDQADQPPQCEISISDTGAGIAEGDVGKIFDPFFTTKENGTGLGLSIVHRIVENYGGKVWVRSQLGRGTTFTIYLPGF